MKIKYQRMFGVLLFLFCLMIFWSGNRLGLLFIDLSKTENALMVPLLSLSNFITSFKGSNYGFKLSFDFIPVFVGIVLLGGVGLAYLWAVQNRKNYRIGEEHGSSRYGTTEESDYLKDTSEKGYNAILSKDIFLNLDTRNTFLNDNILIIGGSGSGKTRFYVKPNVMQMNTNYVITDPKGTLLPEIGKMLKEEGNYDIKVLNLVDMSASMGYNPFNYIFEPNDVLKFVNNLITNTSDNTKTGGDDFFVKTEITMLTCLCFLVMGTADDDERNMPSIMALIDLAEASEEDENMVSTLDLIFQELQEEVQLELDSGDRNRRLACKNSYNYLACRMYNLYKKAAGKTAKSILISIGVRMSVFNLPQLDTLLTKDELNLESIACPNVIKGRENLPDSDSSKWQKTAFFVIISDCDSTFNFVASILYQQLFDLIYSIADRTEKGKLPIHTRFILDEFANIGQIPDFKMKIATMRSREISVNVILQNLAQLKSLYEKDWETIVGNCDSTVFLGGKEYSTLEAISKEIGNTTIDYLSVSETKGSNGSYSKSNQLISRPLIAPDEIGRLDKSECLVTIRGHFAYRNLKYPLEMHPNIELTMDAKNKETALNNQFIFEEELFNKRDTGIQSSSFIKQTKDLKTTEDLITNVTGSDIQIMKEIQDKQ
ncbi:MAG: type IV secretory system conjugative DNA transfer family protein [Bacilli bacterium]